MTEREKMEAGEWYCCLDPELDALRAQARRAVHVHNHSDPDTRGAMAPALHALLARVGQDCLIEAPFHCAYGINIHLGNRVYFNAGCTILDTARVQIGDGTMLGPNVQIYCAQHAKDPEQRAQGLEIAHAVAIGRNVWVGGGAIILPGVTVGDNAIIGAGSVVTKDLPSGQTVVGNPARART
ncbi:sugar O-acetyltransferase [Ruegeria sp.]|uniref:sugar O-acetyltransferase n=1 Tax=Ruegeria sp. TaxID=1879320 RepID=UPI002326329D|nr:sugar O-acetyltransferase [Ruegeria sp.]MDA7965004.1 sugar O-acetyltransferase [Ruegeria sp.]